MQPFPCVRASRFGCLAVACLAALPALSRAAPRTDPPQRYAAAVRELEAFIEREVKEKGIPALSIALVDDQEVVWARGFGYAHPKEKVAATADTVYRVGSVSKLFTDLAVMRLVAAGKLDLDAPVTTYLPDFQPKNPFGKAITLRQMMAHRSGLVREPPVGNYFDASSPSLADMVKSLNLTALVYEPETRIKYSNAAIATVGYVLERQEKEPFARYLKRTLLEPLGMERSAFEPTPELERDVADAVMWTYWGRDFDAPTFSLGMAPAGSMYSTVNELGRFLTVLFSPRGPVARQTVEAMWRPQFAKAGEKTGFGIGFHVTDFDGHRRVGHNGAIYGFATELDALPEDKLGVVVAASRDGVNAVAGHVAEAALRHLLAVRAGQSLPKIEDASPLAPGLARRLAGRYRDGEKYADLYERGGRLWLLPGRGGFRPEVQALDDYLMVDDRLQFGPRLRVEHGRLEIAGQALRLEPVAGPPPPAPEKWAGLLGEYGWDFNTLVVLEREGKLHALIEWFFLYPLEEVSPDVYKFPDSGLYMGERLVFTRGPNGRASRVEAAGVVFPRRPISGEDGGTFQIRPLRPLDELRREALAARPPQEKGTFREPDLVELTALDPTIKLDVRYATANNFLATPLYTQARAFLQRPAAEALVRVHRKLAEQGYGLLIHDAYRPWYVTKMFWEATPPKDRVFVADPSKGSRHNRGCAVDLTLYDRRTGKVVPMVGGYDEMSDRSYPDYLGGTSRQRWHRDFLRHAMEAEGFAVYDAEWWHFDFKDWQKYAVQNLAFEKIEAQNPSDK